MARRKSTTAGATKPGAVLCLAVAVTLMVGAAQGENILLDQLVEQGVQLENGVVERLPVPSMTERLDARAQRAVLERVAGRNPVDEFLRDSVVAPFVLKIEPIKDSQAERLGYRVSLWFVVHGSLDRIADEGLFERTRLQSKERAGLETTTRPLAPEELRQRGISPMSDASLEEKFTFFQVPVLDRVQVRGVVHSMHSRQPLALAVAASLDPRFAEDPQLANQWRPIRTNDLGNLQLGEPRPYTGYGSYTVATELVDEHGSATGVVLIESQTVFREPRAWFDGNNLLTSKLPLAVQDSVRKLRRELKTAAKR